jgi:hypothetical protein
MVDFMEFQHIIEVKLRILALNHLDLKVLARRYKANKPNSNEDFVQFDKFF